MSDYNTLSCEAQAAGARWLETGGAEAAESLRRALDAYREAGAEDVEALETLRRSVDVVESRAAMLHGAAGVSQSIVDFCEAVHGLTTAALDAAREGRAFAEFLRMNGSRTPPGGRVLRSRRLRKKAGLA